MITLIQIADIVAYLISWGVRIGNMTMPARPELDSLAKQVCSLRYRAVRQVGKDEMFGIWSFAVIDDLRPISEKE